MSVTTPGALYWAENSAIKDISSGAFVLLRGRNAFLSFRKRLRRVYALAKKKRNEYARYLFNCSTNMEIFYARIKRHTYVFSLFSFLFFLYYLLFCIVYYYYTLYILYKYIFLYMIIICIFFLFSIFSLLLILITIIFFLFFPASLVKNSL